MKPPKFAYLRARSLDEALAALAAGAGEAKLIAGGQSLMPMLNFRLLAPSMLIDVSRLPGLDGIEEEAGGLKIGALVRHRMLETSPLVARHFPVLTAAIGHVGHLAIRNRGTIGGSLSHNDPAAELPLMAVLLDARLDVASSAGTRSVPIAEFIAGAMSTSLDSGEMLTAVHLPAPAAGTGWGFEEFSRRSGDFALVAAAVLLRASGGRMTGARVALAGGFNGAFRVGAAEAALEKQPFSEAVLQKAADELQQNFEANSDLHASADLRRHLVRELFVRAASAAWKRANGETP